MDPTIATLIVLASFFVLVFLGAPIFIGLGLSSVAGMFMIRGLQGLYQLPAAILGQLESFLLVALPLYLLMGEALSKSGAGADVYKALEKWLNRFPGGLAIASIYACALFGAMCGVSVAGVAAIGVIAVPEMLKRGYDKSMAAGAVTAAGALAVLIPPSISFIIYGAIAGVSVGKLFIAGIVPGVALASAMALYILVRATMQPHLVSKGKRNSYTWKELLSPIPKLWPVFLLILAVLGTIYAGVATPTEAGAIGAAGSLVITAFYKQLNWRSLWDILTGTTRVTATIMIIMASAFAFSQFLNLVRIPETLSQWVITLQMPPLMIVLLIMFFFLLLGCFIDGVSLIIVTTPVVLPTILALGFDPLWYGVILVLNLEMAVITPPVGLNLYSMQSIMKDTLTMKEIIKGSFPYLLVEFVILLLFVLVPEIALWLPGKM
ncbi:TRAP transporter large permease [Desulfocurvus sp. DL9XJH121]